MQGDLLGAEVNPAGKGTPGTPGTRARKPKAGSTPGADVPTSVQGDLPGADVAASVQGDPQSAKVIPANAKVIPANAEANPADESNGQHIGVERAYTEKGLERLGDESARKRAMDELTVVEAIAKKFKLRIRVQDSIKAVDAKGKSQTANGQYDPRTKQITIALDANDGAYSYIAMHELVHKIQAEHGEHWHKFNNFVTDCLMDEGLVDVRALIDEQINKHGMNEDDAIEEVVCNSAPAVLLDRRNLIDLFAQERTLFEKVMNWLEEFLQTVWDAGKALAKRSDWRQLEAMNGKTKALQEIYDQMVEITQVDGEGGEQTEGPMRYSLRETDENVQNQLETLKQAMALSKGYILNAEDAHRLAQKMKSEFNSGVDAQDLATEIGMAFNNVETADEPDFELLDEKLTAEMLKVMNESQRLDMEHEEEAADARHYLRTTAIRLTQDQLEEGANAAGSVGLYRRALFGRVRLNQKGLISLDEAWSELSGIAPTVFQEDTQESDMPYELLRIVGWLKPIYRNDYGLNIDEAAQYGSMRLCEEYMKLKSVRKAAINTALDNYQASTQAFLAQNQAAFDAALQSVQQAKETKAKSDQQQRAAAIVTKYAMWRERDMKKRKQQADIQKYRKSIETNAGALLGMLQNPTDKRHVPEGMREAVSEFVTLLHFDGETLKEKQLYYRVGELARALQDAQSGDESGVIVDEETIAGLVELAQKAKEYTSIKDLSSQELGELSKAVAAVRHMVASANELHGENKARTLSEEGESTCAELGERKEAKQRKGVLLMGDELLNSGMLDSFHFFDGLGAAAQRRLEALREGFDKKILAIAKASTFMQDASKGMKVKELSGDKAKKQRFEVTGGSIALTKAQIMELYELNKRAQARAHIYAVGIRIQDGSVTDVRVTEADVKAMTDTLTAEEKALSDKAQQFLARECSIWGNKASMELYGYRKFGEKDYYPIHVDPNEAKTTDKNQSDQKAEGAGGLYRIKNLGMTKAVVKGANVPILIGDLFDTFARHVDDMSSYGGLAVPSTDMMRWYNYRTTDNTDGIKTTGSVKHSIERSVGRKGKLYVEQLIKDVNGANVGGDHSAGVYDKLVRNAKIAAVGGNLRVVVQQPTAYMRAAAVMSPKYLTAGLAHKPQAELAKRYSPIAQWKSWGFFEMNTGRSLRGMLTGDETMVEKLQQKSMMLASVADEMTWGYLWNACEAEQRALNGQLTQAERLEVDSEAFRKKVGKRLSEVIDRTQVVDSVFHRTEMMRSKNAANKMFTNFMSEPMKTYNMLHNAIAEYARGRSKESGARLGRVMVACVFANVAAAAASALVDAMRNEDDDTYWQKWLNAMRGDYGDVDNPIEWLQAAAGSNLGDGLNPLNYIPYLKEGVSMVMGYKPARMDMQGIQRIWEVFTELTSGKSKWSTYKSVYKTVSAVSAVTGIPAGAIMRDANALYQTITGKITPTMNETASTSYAAENLYHATLRGDVVTMERIREKLGKGEKPKSPAEIDAALATVLAAEDGRAAQAAQAKASGQAVEVERIKREMIADGFEGEVVDKAIQLAKKGEVDTVGKDMQKQLNVSLYATKDAEQAILRAAAGGSREDAKRIYAELIADSEAKNPQKTVRSTVLAPLKKEYLRREASGDTAGAKELLNTLEELLDVTQDERGEWMKDLHSQQVRDAIDAQDSKKAAASIAQMREDGRSDAAISQSITSSFKQKMQEMHNSGYKKSVRGLQKMLVGLGLTNKSGENYFDDEKFAEWLK
ncbi:MAG: hypothetical protein RR367_08230 [Clostridia bacterium]